MHDDQLKPDGQADPLNALEFRVVQPWGPDKVRQSTVISEHATAAEAFAEIDRLSAQMVLTGAPSDAVELIVVDDEDRITNRPEAQQEGKKIRGLSGNARADRN